MAASLTVVCHYDDFFEEGDRSLAHLDMTGAIAAWARRRELHQLLLCSLSRQVGFIIKRFAEVDGIGSDLRIVVIISLISVRESLLFLLLLKALHLGKKCVLFTLRCLHCH